MRDRQTDLARLSGRNEKGQRQLVATASEITKKTI